MAYHDLRRVRGMNLTNPDPDLCNHAILCFVHGIEDRLLGGEVTQRQIFLHKIKKWPRRKRVDWYGSIGISMGDLQDPF